MPALKRRPFAQVLQAHWWRRKPTWLAQILRPLSWLYRCLLWLLRLPYVTGWRSANGVPVPVIVVGNLVVGGAGKTPTVMALVRSLQRAGWRPGVVSRGYGGAAVEWLEVLPETSASLSGDEPLLIHRSTAAPVWVGRQRAKVAAMLCAAHPEVNVVVSDDGLQHIGLARDIEILVFDERGAGNGLCLPAGPLREPLPVISNVNSHVLYNAAAPSTLLPGAIIQGQLRAAKLLHDWLYDRSSPALPLVALKGQPLLAVAGIAVPERFFSMLEAAGLTIDRWPLADHHSYTALPWPDHTPAVLVTEKDAVKLAPWADVGSDTPNDPSSGTHTYTHTQIWVVGLDFQLPHTTVQAVLKRLEELRPT